MSARKSAFEIPLSLNVTSDDFPDIVVPFTFTEGESVAGLTYSGRYRVSQLRDMYKILDRVAEWALTHTALVRRDLNHPHRQGLVPREFNPAHVGVQGTSLEEAAQFHSTDTDPVVEALNLPACLTAENWGWFADGVEATTFGAPYLVPVGTLEGELPEADEDGDWDLDTPDFEYYPLGWVVGQVGMTANMGYARWDDEAGIAKLVEIVTASDVDLLLTMNALTDAEKAAKSVKDFQYRQAVLGARVVFGDAKLRPRVVPDLVSAVAARLGAKLFTRWGHDEATNMISLDDYSIFGWQNQVPALHAAYRIAFDLKNKVKRSVFIDALHTALLEKRVYGVSVVVVSGSPHIYLTRHVEGMRAFPAAFRLTEGTTLEVVAVSEAPLSRARKVTQAA